MKKTIIVTSFFLSWGAVSLHAQQNTDASGGNASGTGGTVSYSVGQIDYIMSSGSGGTANQGVQQPYEFFNVGINENTGINIYAIVYPSPVTTNVILKIENQNFENLSFQVFDLNGKLILEQKIVSSETSISMENLSASTYFLKVMNGNSELKYFKIIKN